MTRTSRWAAFGSGLALGGIAATLVLIWVWLQEATRDG